MIPLADRIKAAEDSTRWLLLMQSRGRSYALLREEIASKARERKTPKGRARVARFRRDKEAKARSCQDRADACEAAYVRKPTDWVSEVCAASYGLGAWQIDGVECICSRDDCELTPSELDAAGLQPDYCLPTSDPHWQQRWAHP